MRRAFLLLATSVFVATALPARASGFPTLDMQPGRWTIRAGYNGLLWVLPVINGGLSYDVTDRLSLGTQVAMNGGAWRAVYRIAGEPGGLQFGVAALSGGNYNFIPAYGNWLLGPYPLQTPSQPVVGWYYGNTPFESYFYQLAALLRVPLIGDLSLNMLVGPVYGEGVLMPKDPTADGSYAVIRVPTLAIAPHLELEWRLNDHLDFTAGGYSLAGARWRF